MTKYWWSPAGAVWPSPPWSSQERTGIWRFSFQDPARICSARQDSASWFRGQCSRDRGTSRREESTSWRRWIGDEKRRRRHRPGFRSAGRRWDRWPSTWFVTSDEIKIEAERGKWSLGWLTAWVYYFYGGMEGEADKILHVSVTRTHCGPSSCFFGLFTGFSGHHKWNDNALPFFMFCLRVKNGKCPDWYILETAEAQNSLLLLKASKS